MYNLFVSADEDSWEGEPYEIEHSRIFEHTEQSIKNSFLPLTLKEINELTGLPCLFAYEKGCDKAPKYGRIKSLKRRQKVMIVDYEIIPLTRFLSEAEFYSLSHNLDIDNKYELRRTHWAVKDVDLKEELGKINIVLPRGLSGSAQLIDINNHNFEIAVSFPGESRSLVEPIVKELIKHLDPHDLFYDLHYQHLLARPSLNTLLQDIYGKRSKLIVVFLSKDYDRKKWCGLEFRAIQEIIMDQNYDKVMYIKMDDAQVSGVLKTDGYIDSRLFSIQEITDFILQRSYQQQYLKK